jgi:hypothetical protein
MILITSLIYILFLYRRYEYFSNLLNPFFWYCAVPLWLNFQTIHYCQVPAYPGGELCPEKARLHARGQDQEARHQANQVDR